MLLLAIFTFAIMGCEDRNPPIKDNDTYSVVRDITGNFTPGNNFAIDQGLTINSTSIVLVYRNINSNTPNGKVWQLIPKTVYLSGSRELDYNYIFDTSLLQIQIDSNFNLNTEISPAEIQEFLINQQFRVVLVPASAGKNSNVDYNNYESVIEYYKPR
jgi:hypothetical protein